MARRAGLEVRQYTAAAMASEWLGFPCQGRHPCNSDIHLVAVTRALLRQPGGGFPLRIRDGTALLHGLLKTIWAYWRAGSEDTLTYFGDHMRRAGLAVTSSRQYLAAVRRLHLQCGRPMSVGMPPYVAAALRGYEPRSGGTEPRRQAIEDPFSAI